MMIDNNNILKILLEADADPNDPQKQPNEKPTKPHGFEEDPMGFIIRKYHGLTRTLVELMSSDFKQYLTAIFVVAPKPTTFKIVLHNGQFFFITYMGKGFYEANIAGKRYYMNNIGTKERAMQAIARLLKFGSPLKTKGPEGAEQGTRDDDGTGNSPNSGFANGGGGGYAQSGGEEGGEEGTEETGGEEGGGEESLKEVALVKSLLKFKNIGQNFINALVKEVYLPSNQKIKVMKTQPLQEAAAPTLKGLLLSQLQSLGFKGKTASKHGAHLRFNLETPDQAEKEIQKALTKISSEKFYKLSKVEKGNFGAGSKSSTFDTYKVEVTKPVAGLQKGDTAFIVNQVTKEGTIVAKSLTPTNLNLTGKTFTDENKLASYVNAQLPKIIKNAELVKALSEVTKDIARGAHTKFKNVSNIKEHEDVVNLSASTAKSLSKFSSTDLNIIGKDFGEVLGAIEMLKSVEDPGTGVEFPGGNNPLVDFFLDGYSISSKYQAGAAASLIQVIKGINPKRLTKYPDQLELYKILQAAVESDTAESYINVAKLIKSKGLNALASCLGVAPKAVTIKTINYALTKIFKGKSDAQKTKILMSKFGNFYEAIGRSPRQENLNWAKIGDKYFGLILSPLAYSVADELNSNPKYTKALKEILSKIEVKQIYLDFNLSKSSASFKVRNFSSATFKFATNVSTYNPTNSKLAFSLIK